MITPGGSTYGTWSVLPATVSASRVPVVAGSASMRTRAPGFHIARRASASRFLRDEGISSWGAGMSCNLPRISGADIRRRQ